MPCLSHHRVPHHYNAFAPRTKDGDTCKSPWSVVVWSVVGDDRLDHCCLRIRPAPPWAGVARPRMIDFFLLIPMQISLHRPTRLDRFKGYPKS